MSHRFQEDLNSHVSNVSDVNYREGSVIGRTYKEALPQCGLQVLLYILVEEGWSQDCIWYSTLYYSYSCVLAKNI